MVPFEHERKKALPICHCFRGDLLFNYYYYYYYGTCLAPTALTRMVEKDQRDDMHLKCTPALLFIQLIIINYHYYDYYYREISH